MRMGEKNNTTMALPVLLEPLPFVVIYLLGLNLLVWVAAERPVVSSAWTWAARTAAAVAVLYYLTDAPALLPPHWEHHPQIPGAAHEPCWRRAVREHLRDMRGRLLPWATESEEW